MDTLRVSRDRPYVAVVGAGEPDIDGARNAEEVGRALARRGAVVFCGGLGGVMEAACRGAKHEGGLTVGILPGVHRADGNPYLDVAISTGMGEMRNALLVRSVDAVVAVGGEFGTLSEIAFALKLGVPVVGLDTWQLVKRDVEVYAFARATSSDEAAEVAVRLARRP
jgi:uncharacterized protein (TIGR00725 family)